MRIKTLTKYNFSTIRNAMIVFCMCYIGATLLGAVVDTLLSNGDGVVMFGVVMFDVAGEIDADPNTWSSSILYFAIFMLVSSLIGSQKDTRFLITRSVSRKEIFVANAVFICPLAAIMGLLQIFGIYLDGFVRWCMGGGWQGLALDFQIGQSPDMNNVLVFFTVSFSILLAFGAISYLFGSLIARWKTQTIVGVTVLFVLSIALLGSTDLSTRIIEAFEFMFLDDTTGLLIALKQVVFAVLIMAISFPIMRKVTAVKQ